MEILSSSLSLFSSPNLTHLLTFIPNIILKDMKGMLELSSFYKCPSQDDALRFFSSPALSGLVLCTYQTPSFMPHKYITVFLIFSLDKVFQMKRHTFSHFNPVSFILLIRLSLIFHQYLCCADLLTTFHQKQMTIVLHNILNFCSQPSLAIHLFFFSLNIKVFKVFKQFSCYLKNNL